VTNVAFENNQIHLSATLLDNPGCSHYGPDIRNLRITISFDTAAQLHIKIQDADHDRYEIPDSFVPAVDQFERWQAASGIADADFKFSFRSRPFAFAVTRKDNNETIFDTDAPDMDALVFEEQYLELSSRLASHARIYGLGEVVHGAFERDKRNTWQTLWARDAATPVDENGDFFNLYYMYQRGMKKLWSLIYLIF
jgi:alpha-glucosidase